MESIQSQPTTTRSSFNARPITALLGLILVSLIGLAVIYYSFFYVGLGAETASTSEILGFLLIPLAVLAFLGFIYKILRKKLVPISTKRCIYEWIPLLVGGGFGIFYQGAFLMRVFVNIPSKFTGFLLEFSDFGLLSSALFILLFMVPFAYLGNYLARTTGEGWSTGNLKLFLKPELIVVLFIIALYVVAPISANQIRISATQEVLSQITLSNFQESLVSDPESKVKKLIITADITIPEDSIYTFNNNIHNQEIDENYRGQFSLDHASMAINEEIKSTTSNFVYKELQAGPHTITFEKSFKGLFDPFIKPTLFQEIVADRNLYMQVRIWKGNRREDNPFSSYVYKTNKYSLSDFIQ